MNAVGWSIARLVTTNKFFRFMVFSKETINICFNFFFHGQLNSKFSFVTAHATLNFTGFFRVSIPKRVSSFPPTTIISAFALYTMCYDPSMEHAREHTQTQKAL